jgi:A/G-specific adenine glycosylase
VPWPAAEAKRAAPLTLAWQHCTRQAEHGFTHFQLRLEVWFAELSRGDVPGGEWVKLSHLHAAGLPTAMRKIADVALDRGAAPRYASRAK